MSHIPKPAQQITEILVKDYKPEKIILFGSFLSSKQKKESDIDICVLKKINSPVFKEKIIINRLLWKANYNFQPAPDLHVYDIKKFNRLKEQDSFLQEINKGKILYEKQIK